MAKVSRQELLAMETGDHVPPQKDRSLKAGGQSPRGKTGGGNSHRGCARDRRRQDQQIDKFDLT